MPSDVGASTSARRQPSTATGFGGRRIQVSRPRIRSTEGTEAVFPSVAAWRQRDPLTARVLEQIVLGVSARGVCRQLEPGPVRARSIIASTEGSVSVPDRAEKVGLNVYRKK